MDDDEWDETNFPLPENAELWERLIRGECSRVVILSPPRRGSMLTLYFPQTLGLPPLRCRYDTSEPQGPAGDAAILAATDRWIAEGEAWARYFMPRAEAIISVETHRVVAAAVPAPTLAITADTVSKWVHRARAGRRRRGTSDESGISALDLALSSRLLEHSRSPKTPSLEIAEQEYPDKLIRVSSRAQVRTLRKVRAPR